MTAAQRPFDEPPPDWLCAAPPRRAASSETPHCNDEAPGATRLQRLQREDAALEQYRDNIEMLMSCWQQEESRLDCIVGKLLDARRLISRTCANGVACADFAGAANSLKSLRHQLARAAAARSALLAEAPSASCVDELWVADGVSYRLDPAVPDIASVIAPLAAAILLFDQPDRERDDVAWRVEIDRTLLDLDTGLEGLNGTLASIVDARHLLQVLGDNHNNLSLSNKHLAMTLGRLDDAAAATLLQSHEAALQANRSAQAALAELSLLDER